MLKPEEIHGGQRVISSRATTWSEGILSLLATPSVQYGGGILLVVLLPPLVRFGPEYFRWPLDDAAFASLIGCALSFTFGLMTTRRLTRYPGTKGAAHIIPVFLATFGLLIALLFFGRIDFSRYQILASFGMAVVWGYAVHVANKRARALRLAVVPFGATKELFDIPNVSWTELATPEVDAGHYDGVVADLHGGLPAEWEELLADCALNRVPVYNTKEIYESLTGRVQIERLSENTIGSLLTSLDYERIKLAVDLLVVVLTLPLTLPIAATAAILIRLESPGPALFRQRRMGFKGRPFTMYKFRTMRGDETGTPYTADADLRVTRFGRILRRYRLDELPQIINIVKGEMSWIGPRPESLALSDWYEKEIPFFKYRHVVRPGISGWAQVTQGYAAGVRDVTDKLHYDFFYIKHFSPWLDLLIAFKTVRTLATGFGAR